MNVLIIGKAKTGTTVISKTIENSISGKTFYHMEPKNIDYFDALTVSKEDSHIVKIIYEHWNNIPDLRNDLIFNKTKLKFDKVVGIVRDPRDEMISRLFYIIKPMKDSGRLNEINLREWLNVILKKEKEPSSLGFFDMVSEFDKIFKSGFANNLKTFNEQANKYHLFLNNLKDSAGGFILKYEDFISNNTLELENYLQLTLSNDRNVGAFERTRRTSAFNNWKEFFIPDDVLTFTEMFGSMLQDCGYSDFDLTPTNCLNPENYSKYVMKISEINFEYNTLDEKSEIVNTNQMKFGIGAIFKDEFDYILEWLAWHRLAGFSRFFIADNGSSDGTRQLLEALSDVDLINVFYMPQQIGAQQLAYKLIQEKWGKEIAAVAFIDADEFIVADDEKKPTDHLESLFLDSNVGAVGINWRVFGSSGRVTQDSELVIKRFLNCANDNKNINRHIKSVVRPEFIETIKTVHHFHIPNKYSYLSGAGDKIVFTDQFGQVRDIQNPYPFCNIVKSPLRINHYIVKSLQEYTEKKRKRGDAQKGSQIDRGQEYFKHHDLNDEKSIVASCLTEDVYKEMALIESILRLKTLFYAHCRGIIDECNINRARGWAIFETEEKPKIMVFVNGKLEAELKAVNNRPDVITLGISKDGFCGFHHEFIPPLKSGDVVYISVYANPFKFANDTFVIE